MILTFLLGLQSSFALNVASLSADIYSSYQIKTLAKKATERANQKNIAIPEKTVKDLEYLAGVKVKNTLKVLDEIGKIGDNVINSVTGDIRKFSEYALTNPSKKGLFVDSWGYKLEDAQTLLETYKKTSDRSNKKWKSYF
ncbi:hypothetical protein [Riemerella columbipharyngis]|uniref:Uncharacterized protein n=1 Tax=Riemerella columbipharyngis TaxID=1071918 RepID=A0A1G7BPT2_9FLAO|nr:hypothetical protein [Riemerella columbipharyngis]SDE28942.1 hypothetical protein SAMN05421544_10672 [Riemerella columbipharyngis]